MINFFSRFKKSTVKEGRFPVLAADKLLQPHEPTLREIRSTIGIDDQYWNALYQPALNAFAAWVQQLPASEFHHHSNAGGLLRHCLDVSVRALRARRGVILPPGATPERAAQEEQVWTYTLFTSALLHDLGKPLTDQIVEQFGKNGQSLGRWNPWIGPMTCYAYAVTYYRNKQHRRDYQLHKTAAAVLAPKIVPPVGLKWISENREAFSNWLIVLTGQEGGALDEIIGSSDKASVAKDLAGVYVDQQASSRAATSSNKPLSERLLIAMKTLIDDDALPLNRDGAAGWVHGDSLWMVTPRALEAIKTTMAEQGQTGVPGNNQRLMDELQSAGMVIANEAGRGVWKMKVFGTGWRKEHSLAMLRFPLHIVWPNSEARPPVFDGTVKTVDDRTPHLSGSGESVPAVPTEPSHTPQAPQVILDTKQNNASSDSVDRVPGVPGQPSNNVVAETDCYAALKLELPVSIAGIGAQASEAVGPSNSESRKPVPTREETLAVGRSNSAAEEAKSVELPPASVGRSNSNVADPSAPGVGPSNSNTLPTHSGSPQLETAGYGKHQAAEAQLQKPDIGTLSGQALGKAFITWLRQGLNDRAFDVNTQNAFIHVTEEGLLLVSPKIFKRFDEPRWREVQDKFYKLRLHERKSDGTNIHTFVVTGKKRESTIKGFLIQDTSDVFPGICLPKPNIFLVNEAKRRAKTPN